MTNEDIIYLAAITVIGEEAFKKELAIKKYEITSNFHAAKERAFNDGFDAAIELALNTIDNLDSNDLPTIEDAREAILEEVELYKKDE
jgi:hypothetical protein